MNRKLAQDVEVYTSVVGIFAKNIQKLALQDGIEYDDELLQEVLDGVVDLDIAIYEIWLKLNAAKNAYLGEQNATE